MLFPEYQRHVRHRVNERVIRQDALIHQGGPELAGHLELLVNAQRLSGVYSAVGSCGCVVQLAQGGVAGTRVIPGVC